MDIHYKSKKYFIGATFESDNGDIVKIIGKDNTRKQYYYIEFQDIHKYINTIHTSNILKRKFKNPYTKTVSNIGFIGDGKYNTADHKKIHRRWLAIFNRCYNNPSSQYMEVEIDEKWYNFQNFAKWFEENNIEGYEIDKDILSNDVKIYSENTCCFVPHEINSFLTNKQKHNKSGVAGVFNNGRNWTVCMNNSYYGAYDDLDKAKEKVDEIRNLRYNELVNKYYLTDKVKNRLKKII